MELLMSIGMYVLVFGGAAVLAVVPGLIAYLVTKKRMGKGWSYFAGVVFVLLILASLSQKPILWYTQSCEEMVSAEQEDAIRSVSSGIYSTRAPFIPMLVMVDECRQGDYARWKEYYFPFGTREMELSGTDGFNCVKHLFPW